MSVPVERNTTALVLETNNLKGGDADRARIVTSLQRLLLHLRSQSRGLSSLQEMVVTHEGFTHDDQAVLTTAAGRAIRFVELAAGTDYYQAKNLGFAATRAEVVAFGDSDCWPDETWLEELLAPFGDSRVQVVAGRTTYPDDLLGAAATAIDFIYFPSPLGAKGEACTRNFYANNVAFRRELFARYLYPAADGIYRGHCQILGLALQQAGVPIGFVPAARTVHRFPDSRREFFSLRRLRGADSAEFAPTLLESYAPAAARVGEYLGPVPAIAVLAARLGFSFDAVGKQDLQPLSAPDRLACFGLVAAISFLDLCGAVPRGLGWGSAARERATQTALSYHADGAAAARATRALSTPPRSRASRSSGVSPAR